MIEHVTARRFERAGIPLEQVAAAACSIRDRKPGLRRDAEVRLLETAIGGMLQVKTPGWLTRGLSAEAPDDIREGLLFSSVPLDEETVWEANSLCRSADGIPITVLQGVDGIPLRSLVDHPDLPDAWITGNRKGAASRALFVTDAIVCDPLPEPTRKALRDHRSAVRRMLREERMGAMDPQVRRSWALKGALLNGVIALLYWTGTLGLLGDRHAPDAFQWFCGAVVTIVPVLSVWSILEANPVLHRLVQRPIIETRHRRDVEEEHSRRVGTRSHLAWPVPDPPAIL